MKLNLDRARSCLKSFDFRKLFVEELDWATCTIAPFQIVIDDHVVLLSGIAEQGGMVIYEAKLLNETKIPPSHICKFIDREVTKRTFEHVIIFCNTNRNKSVWLWVKREQGKATAPREHGYYAYQAGAGDALLQKLNGLFFDLDDLDAEGRVHGIAMKLNPDRARSCLKSFDFRKLFVEELGWANCKIAPFQIVIDDHVVLLSGIAEQGGMVIYEAKPLSDTKLLPSHVRQFIDREVTKRTFEHIIIFTSTDRNLSIWLWGKREQGKAATYTEHYYHAPYSGNAMLLKLDKLFIDLDELDSEGRVPILIPTQRASEAFDKKTAAQHNTVPEPFSVNQNGVQLPSVRLAKGIAAMADSMTGRGMVVSKKVYANIIRILDAISNFKLHLKELENPEPFTKNQNGIEIPSIWVARGGPHSLDHEPQNLS